MGMFSELWDPDNNPWGLGMTNKRYHLLSLDGKNSFISEGDAGLDKAFETGSFYRYKNQSGQNTDILPYVYYNYKTGDVYYPDGTGNHVKHNITISPGAFEYASDDQLTNVANDIVQKIKGAKLDKPQKAPTPVANPVYTLVTPPITEELLKEKEEQEAKLAEQRALSEIARQQLVQLSLVAPVETPKDETVYYNFGPHQFDLKYYIHNLGANLQGYLDSKKNWSNALKEAFIKSYETQKAGLNEQLTNKGNRFHTNDAGLTVDTMGQISGKNGRMFVTSDGKMYNSLDEIQDKKMRKTAVEFSPNDEVGLYLKAVGNKIVSAGKTKKAESEGGDAFDFNKHSFQSYWVNKVNPAGGQTDLNPYLNLDEADETGKRGTTNRATYLANELTNYLNYIKSKNYNYTGTSYENSDNYYAKLQAAIDNLNNGWDPSDAATLQAAGITPDFYNGFFTDGVTPLTEEDKAKLEALAKADAVHSHIVGLLNEHEKWAQSNINNYTKDNAHTVNSVFMSPETTSKTIASVMQNYGYNIELDKLDDPEASVRVGNQIQEATTKFKNTVLGALRAGQSTVKMPDGLTYNVGLFTKYLIPALINSGDMKQDPESQLYYYDSPRDLEHNSILVFDGTRAYYTFVGNVKACSAWLKLKSDYENNERKQDTSFRYSFKEGGVLREVPKYDLGAKIVEDLVAPLAAQAEAKGRGFNNQRLKNRELNGQGTMLNPDNGVWKTEDYVRMGAIGADLVSLGLDPVSGTITNVGSSIAHFIADANDDSVKSGDMWKNLAANLGMDALSIVPVIGDAAGTGTKLVKSLKWAAPKLMYALTAYGTAATLKNSGNIMESLSKVMSDDKLTVGDYQNIAQAISAIVGVGNLTKNKLAQNNAKKQALTEDTIGLRVKDKSGNTQDLVFRGERAKELREKVQTRNPEEVNKFLHSLEDQPGLKFSDFEVSTSVASIRPRVQKPWETVTNADGTTSKAGRNPFYMERKIDAFDIFEGKASGYYTPDRLVNPFRRKTVETNARTKAEIDTLENAQMKDLTQRAHDMTERRRQKILEILEAIHGKKNADGSYDNTGLQGKLNDAITRQKTIAADKGIIDDILRARTAGYSATVGAGDIAKEVRNINIKIRRKNRLIDNLELKEEAGTINAAESKRLEVHRRELDRLVQEKKNLEDWDAKYGDGALTLAQNDFNTVQQSKAKLDAEIALYSKDLENLKKRLDKLNLSTNPTNEKKRLEALLSSPIDIKDESGHTVRTVTKDIKDLMTKYDFMKKGGRLKFLHNGGRPGNVVYDNNIDWYNNYIMNNGQMSQEAMDVYGQINESNLNDYNNLQNNSYRSVFGIGSSNPASGRGSTLPESAQARAHQTNYNNLAGRLNERFETMGLISTLPGANTGDTRAGGWVDGRAGTMTWLRHLGDKLEHVDAINNSGALGEGVEAFWNDKTKMVNFRKKEVSANPPGTPVSTPQDGVTPQGEMQDTSYGEVVGATNDPTKKNNGVTLFAGAMREQFPWLLKANRLGYLNDSARKLAELSAAHILPYHLRYNYALRRVHGDLDEVMMGNEALADMTHAFRDAPLTADGDKQTAAYMDAVDKGLKARVGHYRANNKVIDATREQNWAQNKANSDLETNVANQNLLSDLKTLMDKWKILDAADAQVVKNNDNFMLEGIYYAQQTADENKLKKEQLDTNDLNAAVTYNPSNFGVQFSADEERVYNDVLSGTLPSNLSPEDKNLLITAKQKVEIAKRDALRKYYGLGSSPYANLRTIPETESSYQVLLSKDGSKITVAKIREKMNNAKRFLDSVNKGNDRHTKKMLAINKKMYSLPKSEVIKAK